jgi:hypothetical protein
MEGTADPQEVGPVRLSGDGNRRRDNSFTGHQAFRMDTNRNSCGSVHVTVRVFTLAYIVRLTVNRHYPGNAAICADVACLDVVCLDQVLPVGMGRHSGKLIP